MWIIPPMEGVIELLPEDKNGGVEHYEGFRQHQLPADGLFLESAATAADLATSDELIENLSSRFCVQIPLYCHTVYRSPG
jgi:hypothetical protein